MILTVTPNAALDRVLFIEEWRPGSTMRIDDMVSAVGGKGLDASVSLACLGIPSTALTFLAGQTGQELLNRLEDYGITAVPIWVAGETRVAHVIAETMHKRHTHLIAGHVTITPGQAEQFLASLSQLMPRASWLIAGGSLPKGLEPSFLARILSMAAEAGLPSLVDTSVLPLEPILKAKPTILKLNEAEFAAAAGLQDRSQPSMIQAARDYKALYGLQNLVITRARAGVWALTVEGDYRAQTPAQEALNAAGAGDAISAALAHHLSLGQNWPEALRQAAAVAAATVLTRATAECRPDQVARLLPQVEVSNL